MVKANHPYFNKEQLFIDIEQKQAQSLLGAKDWYLRIVPICSYLGKSSAPEYGAEQIHRAGLEAGLERTMWSTGGRLGFGWSSGYTRQDVEFGVNNIYRNGVSATYVQPLLQNWAGKLDLLEYELSDYTIDYTQVQVYENQENFLLDLSIRFLDWAFFTREVAIREERFEIAKRGLEDVNKRYRANLVDKLDVLRSEDSVRIGVPVFIRVKESNTRGAWDNRGKGGGGDSCIMEGMSRYRMSTKKGIDLKGGCAKVS